MSSWLNRFKGVSGGATHDSPTETRVLKRSTGLSDRSDPNAPIRRLQLHQKILYERMLPGKAFVSAHVNRLQHGFYESNALHEGSLDNVYFVSVHFVFHPYDHRSHRFKSAEIRVSVRGDFDPAASSEKDWWGPPRPSPRILKHAPELLYGAVSPENLQWNFSLSSSLGVTHAPLAATVNPSGGVKSSYKVYDMMIIQGSLRSIRSPLGSHYDIEDGMAVWTLEENLLQRSGLPREFDFVLLIHKPDDVKNAYLTVDVDAVVEHKVLGQYPLWYTNLAKYQPSQDEVLDFNDDIGQRFFPTHPGRGFNFADLPHPLDEYVTMPGTTYPTNDTFNNQDDTNQGRRGYTRRDSHKHVDQNPAHGFSVEGPPAPSQQPATPARGQRDFVQAFAANRHSWASDTLNIRVLLEHSNSPQSPSSRRYSSSPVNGQAPLRNQSVRRRRSRSGLKEYSAQQALQEIARETVNGE